MKTIVIRECGEQAVDNVFTLDLRETTLKFCCGFWPCWIKTPGRCVHRDLDEFYHAFLHAQRAVFFVKVTQGLVSSNLKTLFDRMIPLYLPYISYKTGESMHVPRYDHYPAIEVYYEGDFDTEEDKKIFEEYIHRVFYQFHCNEVVKPIAEYCEREVQA